MRSNQAQTDRHHWQWQCKNTWVPEFSTTIKITEDKPVKHTSSRSMKPVCLKSYNLNETSKNKINKSSMKNNLKWEILLIISTVQALLTINFIFYRSIWMEHTYWVDKLFEFNNRIFLFVKKIKNLHRDETTYSNHSIIITTLDTVVPTFNGNFRPKALFLTSFCHVWRLVLFRANNKKYLESLVIQYFYLSRSKPNKAITQAR